MNPPRRGLLAAVPLLGLMTRTRAADAQGGFPSRAVTMVVPAAPGGSTDALARIVARPMAVALGQSVVVENVGGAGGTIGTRRGSAAAPDGHTLIVGNNGTLAANLSLYANLGFDARDFAPIGLIATVPMVLAASPRSGIRTFGEFMDRLRERGEGVTFGTPGVGSTGHLAPAYFLHLAGLRATLVSYRGAGPAMADLAAGTVDAVIDQTVTMIAAHRGGTAVALAVTGPSRLSQIPEIPTFAEAGMPSFDMQVWNAVCAPRGTPRAVCERLAAALAVAFDDGEARRRLDDLSARAPASAERGPDHLGALVRQDAETWAGVVRATGMRAE